MCLLTEQKVVLHCTHEAVLVPVAEALLALLYPLSWVCTYIPVLPAHFMDINDIVQSPVPFLIGTTSTTFAYLADPHQVRPHATVKVWCRFHSGRPCVRSGG